LRSSGRNLLRNKLRSFLTTLGVAIGVSSVILLTSIGEGVKSQITSQVESLGANLIYIMPGLFEMNHARGESKLGIRSGQFSVANSTLTYGDVLALKEKKSIYAVTGLYNSISRLDDLGILVSTTSVDEDLPRAVKLELAQGRFFSRAERQAQARVAVIGHQANKELFGGGRSLGKAFSLDGHTYTVRGVLRYRKVQNSGPMVDDQNIKFYLPIFATKSPGEKISIVQIIIKAASSQDVVPVEQSARAVLQRRHRGVDFTILKQQDMLETINRIIGMLTKALGGIAAISLLVGGIGIMNIMLVSVTERTQEIGVRKAIGATRHDLLLQFLIESTALSVLGGLTGLTVGIGFSRLLPRIVPDIPTAISLPAVILAILSALIVGVFFGVYPAAKAARLDPIESLRSE